MTAGTASCLGGAFLSGLSRTLEAYGVPGDVRLLECSSCFSCCFCLLLGSYSLSSAAVSKRCCSAVSSVMSTSFKLVYKP